MWGNAHHVRIVNEVGQVDYSKQKLNGGAITRQTDREINRQKGEAGVLSRNLCRAPELLVGSFSAVSQSDRSGWSFAKAGDLFFGYSPCHPVPPHYPVWACCRHLVPARTRPPCRGDEKTGSLADKTALVLRNHKQPGVGKISTSICCKTTSIKNKGDF